MKIQSKKIRNSARGEDCSLRLPAICNFNTETTVLGHINTKNKGVGLKSLDIHSMYICSDCHDVVDDRRKSDFTKTELIEYQHDAMIETQTKLAEKGLICIS